MADLHYPPLTRAGPYHPYHVGVYLPTAGIQRGESGSNDDGEEILKGADGGA